jgi:hypothetical protein
MKILTMRAATLITFLFLFSSLISAQVSHTQWDQLLQQHVTSKGEVDYNGMKADKAKLKSYIDVLKKNTPEAAWKKEEIMAYWINAYNAFTIWLILERNENETIMNIEGGKAWDLKFIQLGGSTYSLNNIENDILRKDFKEPRIHFAVNCAAKSCPKLNNKAFTAANLNQEMNRLAKEFVNNSSKNQLSPNAAKVSKIFEWYKGDFTMNGSLIDYLNKYALTNISSNAPVTYMEYDWNLNKK